MKIYYNSIGEIVDQNITEDTWVQGDEDSKILSLYFSGITLADYVCRVVIERGDGDTSNELVTTNMGTYYKLLIPAWVCAASGTVKITSRLKIGSTVVIATTQAERVVSDGVLASDESITNAEYAALLSLLDTILPIDTSMSSTSEKVVQNKVIKAYIDNLARVKNTKIVGVYDVENYGYVGVDADLNPYFRAVDNASSVPTDLSYTLLHTGNLDTLGSIYNYGTFASLTALETKLESESTNKIGKAILSHNSGQYEAFIALKYTAGAIYTTIIAGPYFIYATYNGGWTNIIKNITLLELCKYKTTSVIPTGASAPYTISVTDADITGNSFVRIMGNDAIGETTYQDILNSICISNEPTINIGSFSFSTNSNNSGNPIQIKYIITECEHN